MKLSKYILFALIYIAIQAIGMAVMYYGFGILYGSREMVNVVLWVEIILAALVVFYVRKYASWKEVGYGKTHWVHMIWIAPNLVLGVLGAVGVLMGAGSAGLDSSALMGLLVVTVTLVLVGFAEETMFRGIVLRGAMKRHNIFVAMLISAVAFSLLHIVNVLGGVQVSSLPGDQFSQFAYGLFMAPMAVLIGNLTPLILVHFLWDWAPLAGNVVPAAAATPGPFALVTALAVPVQFVMTAVAWIVVFVLWRRGQFPKD